VDTTKFLLKRTIIIIIRHELRLYRPVATLSRSIFKGLPCRLRPFGLQFSIRETFHEDLTCTFALISRFTRQLPSKHLSERKVLVSCHYNFAPVLRFQR